MTHREAVHDAWINAARAWLEAGIAYIRGDISGEEYDAVTTLWRVASCAQRCHDPTLGDMGQNVVSLAAWRQRARRVHVPGPTHPAA